MFINLTKIIKTNFPIISEDLQLIIHLWIFGFSILIINQNSIILIQLVN